MASIDALTLISKAFDSFFKRTRNRGRIMANNRRMARRNEKIMLPAAREMLDYMVDEARKGLPKLKSGKMSAIKRIVDWKHIKEQATLMIKPAMLAVLAEGGKSIVERKIVKQERFDPIGIEAVGWASEHSAKLVTMVSEETEKAIRAYVVDGVKRGKSIPKIARELRPLIGLTKRDMLAVANYEEWLIVNRPEYTMKTIREMADTRGRRYIRRRGERIARTETASALSEGTLQGYGQMGVKRVEGVSDPDACEECKEEISGKVYTLAEASGKIPVHPDCLLGDSLVSPRGRITSISKRWYDGEVIVIKTASKRKLTCTPNHPILSDRGFCPANSLNVGSHVISDGLSQRESFCYWKNVNKPTSIQEIAESFLKNREMVTCKVPVTRPDFHSDGIGSKIAIISTNRFLMNGFNSSFRQHFLNLQFKLRKVRRLFFDCLSMLAFGFPRDCFPTRRFMRSFNLMILLRLRHLTPKILNGFALIPDVNIPGFQTFTNDTPRNTIFFSNLAFRPARIIQSNNLINWEINTSKLPKLIPNTFLDKIIHINASSYHGYVYNLETTKSYYIANGIASHNCECGWVAA